MTKLSDSFMRIISFSSKLNAKSRDVTLNMQFSVKSLNYLTNKDLHRSQSLKSFIRQRFYWLPGFKKQVASSLISKMPFWKDTVGWFWNTLRRVQSDHSGIAICISLSLQYSFSSITIGKGHKISGEKRSSSISCVWNQGLCWALDPSYYINKLVIPQVI